jgi:hypothetical protein
MGFAQQDGEVGLAFFTFRKDFCNIHAYESNEEMA